MTKRPKSEESVESPTRQQRSGSRGARVAQYEEYYRSGSYMQDYAASMDARVENDPKEAIGGAWEEVGNAQFQFLISQGLRPHHKLLDIGCGTLRAGRHFINYLGAKKYTGIDVSPKAIEHGRELVRQDGLSEKDPRLLVNTNGNLKFEPFEGETFDYLLAHAVFIHLGIEYVDECIANIGQIMSNESYFFFTFRESHEVQRTSFHLVRYPFSAIRSLAEKNGFELTDLSDYYQHPKRRSKQKMVRLTRANLQNGVSSLK